VNRLRCCLDLVALDGKLTQESIAVGGSMAILHSFIVQRNRIVPSSFAGFGNGLTEIHDEVILVSCELARLSTCSSSRGVLFPFST
jgi:hypothetical protein